MNGNRSYYGCHRSGSSRLTGTGKRLKWSHSSKIGSICPARIVVTNIEGRITVDYCKTHVGHSKSIKFLHLTKEERDELAGKIKIGVTFDRILDDIRESVVSNENIHRLHIVDKRDLYNIVRDYELDRDVVHKNDAFSTEMWVQEQMALGEDSPVLYFKMQGSEKNDDLMKDDFMIVLMTKYQQDILSKYAIDKVCIDSTHGTTEHDFQLTTMLTIDEFGAGCPVAFCISNRIDSVAMSQFFTSVKRKMGLIPAKILMSDDAPTYINAWTKVMCKPQHHLICNWHIDRSWRNNLNKIPDPMKQSEVYKACRTLMEILDTDKFHESLESFLAMCNDDIDTHNFGAYFEKHYAHRPEQWAFCYRSDLALNTNMFLEAMHKKLKYCYMHGNQNRRVDKCISFLMRFSRDMMFERIIRMAKNKPTFRMEQIAYSHHQSNNIEDSKIKIIDEKTWLVQSSSGQTLYSVSINDHRSCMGCPLSCPECKVCVHYYTCTCIDFKIKGNFCKHVHACVRISKKKQTNLTNEEVTTLAFENHNNSVVMGSQDQTPHLKDAVSAPSQLTALLNAALGIASSATDEGKLKACKKIEEAIQILQSNKNVPENSNLSGPHFSELPNMPSHKNIDQQRFHSTKKKRKLTSGRLSKPTKKQKVSILEAINHTSRSSQVVNTECDHIYYNHNIL